MTAEAGGLIVTQVLLGFLQGPLIPAISSFSAGWFPVEERSRTISIIFMGINVRKCHVDQVETIFLVFIFQTFGIFSAYLVGFTIDSFGRWDIAFYGYAAITVLSSILFVCETSN